MTPVRTYSLAALAAVPAIAMVQPAYAGEAESHQLAEELLEVADNLSDNVETLAEQADTPAARVVSLMVASLVIRKDELIDKIGEESGMTKRDMRRLEDKLEACKKRNSANAEELLQREFSELQEEVRAAMIILAFGSDSEDSEERKAVIKACGVLLKSAIYYTTVLLENIESRQDANDLASIIAKIDYHVTVVSTYMSNEDNDAYESLAEEVQDELSRMYDAMRDIKNADYYGNDDLRDFCKNRVD